MRSKYGKYVVGNSIDLKMQSVPKYGGYDLHYVVDSSTNKIVGIYPNLELAENLAIGLDKTDRVAIDKEMDDILSGKQKS